MRPIVTNTFYVPSYHKWCILLLVLILFEFLYYLLSSMYEDDDDVLWWSVTDSPGTQLTPNSFETMVSRLTVPYPDYFPSITVGTVTHQDSCRICFWWSCTSVTRRRVGVLGLTLHVKVTVTHRRLWDSRLPIMCVTKKVFVLKQWRISSLLTKKRIGHVVGVHQDVPAWVTGVSMKEDIIGLSSVPHVGTC